MPTALDQHHAVFDFSRTADPHYTPFARWALETGLRTPFHCINVGPDGARNESDGGRAIVVSLHRLHGDETAPVGQVRIPPDIPYGSPAFHQILATLGRNATLTARPSILLVTFADGIAGRHHPVSAEHIQ